MNPSMGIRVHIKGNRGLYRCRCRAVEGVHSVRDRDMGYLGMWANNLRRWCMMGWR